MISDILKRRRFSSICALFIYILINFSIISADDKHNSSNSSNVTIKSDLLTFDSNDLSATFTGKVVMNFEDILLKTDYLIVNYIENQGKRSINNVTIPGKVKIIKQFTDEVAIADKGEYIVSLNKLILTGNVNLEKDGHLLITDKMIYLIKDKK